MLSQDAQQLTLLNALGTKLYGYCDGYFGDCTYSGKPIVGIGPRWLVVESKEGEHILFRITQFDDVKEQIAFINEHSQESKVWDE